MKRIREWIVVLRVEGKAPGFWMLKFLLSPRQWRDNPSTLTRLRECYRCPIYNRKLHQCRIELANKRLGCGCHMPTKIRFGGGCWAREIGASTEIGWK